MDPPVLPSPFLLKANTKNKYLSYQLDAESDLNEIVQFFEDNENSRFIKFITEKPNNEDYADKNYVHIKCSYIGNYLRRVDQNKLLVLAAAADQNETKDNWTCTLFKVEPVEPPNSNNLITRCRLRHLQTDLLTTPFIENIFELSLNQKTHDARGVDIYQLLIHKCISNRTFKSKPKK
ncbi:hypothetical protein DVH24_009354 [Malus domestica]|uniref:Agglutinin domain-containing protein n=1 Tax=Malus domestica TaxID=3750 RepID=A0A498IVW1_MALDO|nr:hypothetical protein DVH24_009354 [Malus domestica]